MALYLILAAIVLVCAFLIYRHWAKRQKRERLLATPLTPEQRRITAQLVPIMRRLPPTLAYKLEGKMQIFLDQVTFRGHNGVQVTEPMRLSIAAQACLLVVNSSVWYDTLRNVLIYPSTFKTNRETHDGMFVRGGHTAMLGESWARGPVVLSWDAALEGGLDDSDGFNVVIHEFAHQLDGLSGYTNAVPVLSKGQSYAGWEKAMLDAYRAHLDRVQAGAPTLIDPYGATNHEEFFAEAMVVFFEKPADLKREEPALYEQLSQLLALDPAGWG